MLHAPRKLFRFVDPPEGQAEAMQATLDAIDYPWWRLLAGIDRDPDGAVLVRWLDLGQKGTGLYDRKTVEVHLSTRYPNWQRDAPFVLAHEVGHAVDFVFLDEAQRADLLALFHAKPAGRWDGQENPNVPGEPHPLSHDAREHPERWVSVQKDYVFRPRESFADLFVRAFAPSIWADRYPRFVHWTDDLDTFRSIVLRPKGRPVATDVDDDRWSAESIRKAKAAGVIVGDQDGRFRPDEPVTREQLAVILDRLGALDPRP